jgi:hypothetical protein
MLSLSAKPFSRVYRSRGRSSPRAFAVNNTATQEVANMNSQSDQEPIPMMQKFLDNPFLLLFFGVMVPMLVYTLWGVIEILTVPLAK